MYENLYFKDLEDKWHTLISRLYLTILTHVQAMRAQLASGLLATVDRLFLKGFLEDNPLESLPVRTVHQVNLIM